ncbi:MAG: tRNA 2-thiouridine(34) synthase MnmA, partial [Defluviitaleaceae bacterium]|nr:tRNA 2-thiouridine(34) synthase MnmA [Defluviitaleaceae bacterium]
MNAVIALSGGVDSAAAALLLKQSGYNCIGVTMRMISNDERFARELADAKAVAKKLGIEHETIDVRKFFNDTVVIPFAKKYLEGSTPNPCVICNREIKFAALAAYAEKKGIQHIATGHYARTVHDAQSSRRMLLKAKDESKDQSYVLHSLQQDVVNRLLLPVGSMSKAEVRSLAVTCGLTIANKTDSQDICFVPDGDYASYIETLTGRHSRPGFFIDTEKNILGMHGGVIRYTVGQRKKLGVSSTAKLYVKSKDIIRN